MRATVGLVGLLTALGIGYFFYATQIRDSTVDRLLPHQVNLVAVQRDLLALAQSEKTYLAIHGSYATLDQLRESGMVNPFPNGASWGYVYDAEVEGATHFRITATPTDTVASDNPTLSIDETMHFSR